MSWYPTQAARKAKRAEEKRRRLETPEIRAAREAREELEKCSAERDEECIYADLARRLDLRERYWTAFETWVRCQRVVEQMKCDKKLRLAVGPDVQIKVDEDIVTAEGYQDLKREVLVLYTMEHSDYLYQRDWCGDAWCAARVLARFAAMAWRVVLVNLRTPLRGTETHAQSSPSPTPSSMELTARRDAGSPRS